MSVSRTSKRPAALLLALVVLTAFAFVVPLGGIASAGHNTSHDLECQPDQDDNQTGQNHTVNCWVLDTAANEVVRLEISGDADGNTPESPDLTDSTCTAADAPDTTDESPSTAFDTNAGGADDCLYTFTYTSNTARTDTLTAWIDDDSNISTQDFDTAEGRNAGTSPGNIQPEPDDTDVMEKTWFTDVAANAAIDCTDESGDDAETNQAGQSETYTCVVFNDANTNAVRDSGEATIQGVNVDAEIQGANDPDNRGFTTAGNTTADVNNIPATDANGQTTFVFAPSEGETGNALVCFWIDADNDAVFANGGSANDGGECEAERVGTEATSLRSDVVSKTWQAAGVTPANLDAEPEVDNNPSGTSHTITATVRDAFGNPVANQLVDMQISGGSRNTGVIVCDGVPTNAQGQVTCNYNDAGTATSSGTDFIAVFVDQNDDDLPDNDAGADERVFGSDAEVGVVDVDLTDQVKKIWTAGGPPAPAAIIVDMNPLNGCDDAADSAATDSIQNMNAFCGEVRDAGGNLLQGQSVTLTLTGPGTFANDANGNNVLDAGEDLGTTITVTTNTAGRFDATLWSTQAGTTTVTGTAGSATDSGTKTWIAGPARNITCTPETASNPPGTQHVVTCLVTDRFGNPSQDTNADGLVTAADTVTFTETGPGFIVSPTAPAPVSAAGTVEVRVSSSTNEEGDQTITAELAQDLPAATNLDNAADLDDPCDQAAGNLSTEEGDGSDVDIDNVTGVPAGNCEDSVTKTWEPEPQPECSDTVDNDADGLVDFPADPDCTSAADPTEQGPAEVTHDRTVNITRFRHINLPGKKRPALQVRGTLSATPAFEDCVSGTVVKVQIRASGQWITRKTDNVNDNGRWGVLIRDIRARYRAVAVPVDIPDDALNQIHHCLRDTDRARHNHG